MAQENASNEPAENNDLFFPEGSESVIENILKKYDLEKTHREGLERFFNAPSPEERQEIINNLPGMKISRLLRMIKADELKSDELSKELEKNLNVSTKESEEMAETLKAKVLIPSEPIEEVIKKEEPTAPRKQDIYRESTQ